MSQEEKQRQRVASQRLLTFIRRPRSQDTLERNRLLNYGGAAAMLAVVLQIVQISSPSQALVVAAIAGAIAVPALLTLGMSMEYL